MEKNKRNKIIGLSIGILIVLIIVVSSTYAYWQITRTQETPNDIVAACLNLNLEDVSGAIDLDSAWPISDEEGKTLTGYTFTVTNNCDEEINYIVGLNRVEESNYLLDSSIKLQLDDNSSHVYGNLSDVEYADSENTYTSRVSKQVSVETISANATNTHTIRVWVSVDAPVTEQSKTFLGQVFIIGGQGIEVTESSSCFTIADNGTIIGYDYACGTEVKVPAEINGIQVKEINPLSFYANELAEIYGFTEEDGGAYIYIFDPADKQDVIDNYVKEEWCDDCTDEILDELLIVGPEEYNEIDWSQFTEIKYEMDHYIKPVAANYMITTLDLSDAIYLNKISEGALNGYITSRENINDTCEYDSSIEVYYCNSSLSKVIFPKNGELTSTGKYAFSDNMITEIELSDSISTISRSSFENNRISNNFMIPSQIKVIEEAAFSDNEITSLTFEDTELNPSKLEFIGEQAFSSNNITGKIIIPSSVHTIDGPAFDHNPNITEIIIKREDSTGMNFGSYWSSTSGNTTVTYDPNYTE